MKKTFRSKTSAQVSPASTLAAQNDHTAALEEAIPKLPDARKALTAEQIVAAFVLDAPVPCRVLYGLYGSRSTFHHWKCRGLEVKKVEGMGPTIIPSAFKAFLLTLRGDAA